MVAYPVSEAWTLGTLCFLGAWALLTVVARW